MLRFLRYLKEGAVLQRGEPVTVKGYGEGEILCTLSGEGYRETKRVKATGGRFLAEFKAVEETGGYFELSAASGGEEIRVRVRFGDVYLALGQSNMSYSLSAVENAEGWQERAEKADVSVLNLEEKAVGAGEEMTRPAYPQEDLAWEYEWSRGGEKLSGVSALCVQTGTLLWERSGVPIGFVQTAIGGLSVEAYLRRESVEKDEELVEFLKRVGRYASAEEYNRAGSRNYTQLSGVWNEKIAPLEGLRFKGIVWYLGESSAYDFEFGRFFLRELKILWREYVERFKAERFVAVHIAPEYYPYGDKYGYLYINEALTQLQEESGKVTTVPIYDIEPRWRKGDGGMYYHPIHPVNKAPIAKRIADALEGRVTRYPQIAEVRYEKGEAICRIKEAGKGMKRGKANGFTLAGKNGKYYPAEGEVTSGEEIRVRSRDVKEAHKLTYGFMQYQDFCSAKTEEGLPLLPYRSEVEAVNGKYCFPPAYTVNGALRVYENNFGWEAGTCRKVPVWKQGEIYDGAETEIGLEGESLCCMSSPTAEEYFFFGISPSLCLAGHKNHLGDYQYWNVRLKGEGRVTFLGVVVRTAEGEIYRLDLRRGKESPNAVALGPKFEEYAIELGKGKKGDGSPVRLSKEERRKVVEAEFVFRAQERVKVYLKDLTLSDKNFSQGVEERREQVQEERKDIKLPERYEDGKEEGASKKGRRRER